VSTRFLTANDTCTISNGITYNGTISINPTPDWNYYEPTYTQPVINVPVPTYVPVPMPVVVIPTIWVSPPTVIIKEEKMEERMFVYEITVIDKKECKILTSQTVVAKDRQSAMLELDLTPEIKSANKKGEIEFIFTEKGAFNKVEKKEK
jgi:hypothetical protein